MRRFEVRLEAQDGSGHFRVTTLYASSKAEARAICERDEYRRAGFQLGPEVQQEILAQAAERGIEAESIDDLPKPGKLGEDRSAFQRLDPPARARLNAHYQEKPYKVVSVKEG